MNLKQQIYHAIVDHHRRFGQVPQREELQRSFRHDADDTVDAHLDQLAREGLIVLGDGPTGPISLASASARPVVELGIQGHASRGTGTIALDLSGIGLPLGDEAHALRVTDDLMIDAGIRSGDIAILKPGVPLRGDIVAAMIGDRLVLRRLLVIRSIPHLLAENPGQPDLRPAFDTQLQGILCALLRLDFERRPSFQTKRTAVSYVAGSAAPGQDGGPSSAPAPVPPRPGKSKSSERTWPEPPSGNALNEPLSAGFDAKTKKRRPPTVRAGSRRQ